MKLTLKELERLKALGMIKDFKVDPLKPSTVTVGGRKVVKHWNKKSKEKDWIGWNLLIWCQERGYTLEEEYKFHSERKWRFDYFIKELNVGIEYNGIFSEKSRHTTASGYTGDMDKLNAAQALGFRVIQLTPINYRNLLTELEKFIPQ